MKTFQIILIVVFLSFLGVSGVMAQEVPELTWTGNYEGDAGDTVEGLALIETDDRWVKVYEDETHTLQTTASVNTYEGNNLGLDAEYNRLTQTQQNIKLGDVNGDGDIDVMDVVLVMRFALDLEKPTSQQREAADVNGDGDINVSDVVLIMRHALELIDSFPVEQVEPDPEPDPEPDGKPSKPYSQEMWITIPKISLDSGIDITSERQEGVIEIRFAKEDIDKIPNINVILSERITNFEREGLFFKDIETLDIGDLIYLEYQGKLYIYEYNRQTKQRYNRTGEGEGDIEPDFKVDDEISDQMITLIRTTTNAERDDDLEPWATLIESIYIQGKLIDVEE